MEVKNRITLRVLYLKWIYPEYQVTERTLVGVTV